MTVDFVYKLNVSNFFYLTSLGHIQRIISAIVGPMDHVNMRVEIAIIRHKVTNSLQLSEIAWAVTITIAR